HGRGACAYGRHFLLPRSSPRLLMIALVKLQGFNGIGPLAEVIGQAVQRRLAIQQEVVEAVLALGYGLLNGGFGGPAREQHAP
nr:hypothetical protein [Tanacetum cinerariifolium]